MYRLAIIRVMQIWREARTRFEPSVMVRVQGAVDSRCARFRFVLSSALRHAIRIIDSAVDGHEVYGCVRGSRESNDHGTLARCLPMTEAGEDLYLMVLSTGMSIRGESSVKGGTSRSGGSQPSPMVLS